MKLSVSQILSQSAEDFKKLIINPVILVLFTISASLSVIPEFIPEESPLMLLLIPIALVAIFIYAYQIMLLYNLKKGENQNILQEVSSLYLKYLWYTLILIGIFTAATLIIVIPGVILYFLMDQSVWIIVLAAIIYIPAILYLSARLFFYSFLVVLEKDKTPIATSWGMTKQNTRGILLLFIILFTIMIIAIVPFYLVFTGMMKMTETTTDLLLLPLDIIMGVYMSIAFLNTFLFCRTQIKAKEIKEEILAGNE